MPRRDIAGARFDVYDRGHRYLRRYSKVHRRMNLPLSWHHRRRHHHRISLLVKLLYEEIGHHTRYYGDHPVSDQLPHTNTRRLPPKVQTFINA